MSVIFHDFLILKIMENFYSDNLSTMGYAHEGKPDPRYESPKAIMGSGWRYKDGCIEEEGSGKEWDE